MLEDTDVHTPSETNFDLEYDYQPLEKGFFQRMEEKMFRLMSGDFLKRKKKQLVKEPIPQIVEEPLPVDDEMFESPTKPIEIAPLKTKEPRKSILMKIREKIHFPTISKAITNGSALIAFMIGAYMIYLELPTHLELVLGIIVVSIAGNVIVSSR